MRGILSMGKRTEKAKLSIKLEINMKDNGMKGRYMGLEDFSITLQKKHLKVFGVTVNFVGSNRLVLHQILMFPECLKMLKDHSFFIYFYLVCSSSSSLYSSEDSFGSLLMIFPFPSISSAEIISSRSSSSS